MTMKSILWPDAQPSWIDLMLLSDSLGAVRFGRLGRVMTSWILRKGDRLRSLRHNAMRGRKRIRHNGWIVNFTDRDVYRHELEPSPIQWSIGLRRGKSAVNFGSLPYWDYVTYDYIPSS